MQLVLALQTRSVTLPKQNKQKDTEQTLKEQFELVDTVMFIPVSDNIQIRISIIRKLEDRSMWVLIHNFKLKDGIWKSYGKVQIPFSSLKQLAIRINALNQKYNRS